MKGSPRKRGQRRSRAVQHPHWIAPYVPTIEAVVALLAPHVEAVVHDLHVDRIAAIWNPLSGRAVGDASLLDELPGALEEARVFRPYERVTLDGKRITSVSALLMDGAGERRGLLCINLDRSQIDAAIDFLSSIGAAVAERPRELFERDWREQIALVVDDHCRQRNLSRDRLDRAERIAIIRELDARNLFATRHAASHVAMALNVSRANLYTMLKEARSGAGRRRQRVPNLVSLDST